MNNVKKKERLSGMFGKKNQNNAMTGSGKEEIRGRHGTRINIRLDFTAG